MDNYHMQTPPRKGALFAGLALAGVILAGVGGVWAAEPPGSGPGLAPQIKAVLVEGNQRVEESTIRFHINTRKGASFSVYTIREDLKKIYSLGYFEDVKVDVTEFE